ncbi:MAG TPA: TonB-dependent receptor [Steroidobacteraceae bacterium]|nr:TonB-dependent receptor [Steroidobacteraceae bacterium]
MIRGCMAGRALRSGLLGLLAATFASRSQAQFPGPDPDYTSEPVIITASRVGEPASGSFWSSSILTQQDIQTRQVQSVQDLLADLAGINVGNAGGLGKQSSLFLRGTNSDHTLLLIDGVRVGSATAGTAPIQALALEQIDRIEIVRGPRSTLYGSDAMGGVIQIFTRRAPQAGLSFGASVSEGSHDTHDVSGDLQARGERAWVNLGAENLTTNGYNPCVAGAPLFFGCATDAPGLDGYRNHSGSLAAGVEVTSWLSAEVHSMIADGQNYFDAGTANREEFSERVHSLSLDGSLGQEWHAQLQLGRSEDVERDFLYADPVDRFITRRDSASLSVDGHINSMLRLVSGADYYEDRVDSDTGYIQSDTGLPVTSRHTTGVFSELRGEWAGWSALAGARYEDNQQFGHHLTENAGIGRKLGDTLQLTLTWGTAFHAPTFNDLYYPLFSNSHLQPEQSRSIELGADGKQGPLHWSAHVYQTRIDRLIEFNSLTFVPENLDRARIRGAELQADWQSRDWKLAAQYTHLDPLDLGAGDNGADLLLPRRAKDSGSLEVRRLLPRASLGLVGRWEGRRFDDFANTTPLGGYFTLDLLGEWRFARGWQLEASCANLLNRVYQTAAYFNQDRLHYRLTVRYQLPGKSS